MSNRQAAGQAAEDAACAWLQQQGLRLLARNVRARVGELDLIMADGSALVIVEVRYRARSDHGSAAETVTAHKQRRIIAATRYWLARHPQAAEQPIRFDVVAVDGNHTMHWIQGAFDAV